MGDDEDPVVRDGIYAGMLRRAPGGAPAKNKSRAESAFANQKGTLIPANLLGGVPDFLRESGIVVGTDEDFQAAADEEVGLLKKLRSHTHAIRAGAAVTHVDRPGVFVVLKTNVDITATGQPRHLVVEKESGAKFKAVAKKLKPV